MGASCTDVDIGIANFPNQVIANIISRRALLNPHVSLRSTASLLRKHCHVVPSTFAMQTRRRLRQLPRWGRLRLDLYNDAACRGRHALQRDVEGAIPYGVKGTPRIVVGNTLRGVPQISILHLAFSACNSKV